MEFFHIIEVGWLVSHHLKSWPKEGIRHSHFLKFEGSPKIGGIVLCCHKEKRVIRTSSREMSQPGRNESIFPLYINQSSIQPLKDPIICPCKGRSFITYTLQLIFKNSISKFCIWTIRMRNIGISLPLIPTYHVEIFQNCPRLAPYNSSNFSIEHSA